MKNPELFVKSVDTLVDAYEKGNLKHLDPCNCAVGNLIAYSARTYNYDSKTGGSRDAWVGLMDMIREKTLVGITKEKIIDHDKKMFEKEFGPDSVEWGVRNKLINTAFNQTDITGYTANEIEKIEAAFENCEVRTCGIGNKERNVSRYSNTLNGLLRAVKVLGEIHEIPKETITCMQEKIATKTYKKSFDLIDPEESEEIDGIDFSNPATMLRVMQRAIQTENPTEYLEKRGLL